MKIRQVWNYRESRVPEAHLRGAVASTRNPSLPFTVSGIPTLPFPDPALPLPGILPYRFRTFPSTVSGTSPTRWLLASEGKLDLHVGRPGGRVLRRGRFGSPSAPVSSPESPAAAPETVGRPVSLGPTVQAERSDEVLDGRPIPLRGCTQLDPRLRACRRPRRKRARLSRPNNDHRQSNELRIERALGCAVGALG